MERLRRMPELLETIHPTDQGITAGRARDPGHGQAGAAAPVLTQMLDENEFLAATASARSPGSTRSIPYVFYVRRPGIPGRLPAGESNTGMFGGNSNWRGPVWMPVNAFIIRALLNFYRYYGDEFKVECPTGSGR